MARITVTELAKDLPDEESAWKYLENMRWHGQPVCPHCGSSDPHYFLTPQGEGRKTRTGTISVRRVWKCKSCRKQFSVTTGTIFHSTRVSPRIWIFVLFEMAANRNGIAAREIERKYGVAPKTAWMMTQKIRTAMANRAPGMMVGTIIADESWVGGDPKNGRHYKRHPEPEKIQPGAARPNQMTDKQPIVAIVNADTGEIHSTVVTDVSGARVRKAIAEHVDIAQSHLMTDEPHAYTTMGQEFLTHETVNHSQGEYSRKGVSSNKAENFFSQLKRSLDGTHRSISKAHLGKYLGEFAFRSSTRDLSDQERMELLMGQTEVRVSYKRIKMA
jgi:transposase-like protein